MANERFIDELYENSENEKIISYKDLNKKIKAAQNELDNLNKKNSDLINHETIVTNAKTYLSDTVRKREDRFTRNRRIADFWTVFSLALIGSCLYFIYRSFKALNTDDLDIWSTDISWSTASFLLLKGAFFISAFGIALRVSIAFRDRYAKEAELDDQKIHALGYGQFFVETYGAVADRKEVVEALNAWHSNHAVKTEKGHDEPLSEEQLDKITEYVNKKLGEAYESL